MKRSRLRSVSKKRRAGRAEWDAVYEAVDQRARGRCEVVLDGIRCHRRARDHHHCLKPRAVYNAPPFVIAICREEHEQVEAPYDRGRLVIVPVGDGTFDASVHRVRAAP